MTPLKLLELVYKQLKAYDGSFAVAGGLAASYYRKQPRLTNDIDIAFFVKDLETTKETAVRIIEDIGYDTAFGWIDGLKEIAGHSIALVIGRRNKDDLECTIDFLVPSLPWVEKAVLRGQANRIDFGFSKLPTLTPEDVIIAKTFALQIEANRYQDMDDIKSILEADNQLDLIYLVAEFESFQLSLPPDIEQLAPHALRRASKKHSRGALKK